MIAPRRLPLVGHEDCVSFDGEHEEWATWIGKPWRRIEYLRQRSFYRGECVHTQRTWSLTVGLLRLGWHVYGSVTRAVGGDYSDEEHQ